MPNRRTVVIPVIPRVAGPEDILIRAFANRQTFGALTVLPDVDLQITKITNVSQLGSLLVLPAGDDIEITAITNISLLGDIEVQDAGPDQIIRITKITNASVLGDIEVAEAPPDVTIYISMITNVSVMGDISVELIPAEGDTDTEAEGVGGGMVGETVI